VTRTADVAVIGAGIAGVSAAYHLTAAGVGRVVLIDERPPLSLTSDKSTECYRNWWPGPGDAMVALMSRSIDLLEQVADQTGNRINLNRRGYLFATADPDRVRRFQDAAEESASLGAGTLRVHRGRPDDPPYRPAPPAGFHDQPAGADLITDPALIRRHFPYLSERTTAVLHARRCGWFSGHQLGSYLLEEARRRGAELIEARVDGVDLSQGGVRGLKLANGSGYDRLEVGAAVIAAGPLLEKVAGLFGVSLPVYAELHAKAAMPDPLGVVPREAPLLIWSDPQAIPWNEEERVALQESPEAAWMLEGMPAGVHLRPEGSGESSVLLMLWTYDTRAQEPHFPPRFDPHYAEVTLRGMSAMIPGLRRYFGRQPRTIVDGGYYLKTRENRPLVGPLPVKGAYVLGALSGFGLMAAMAGGELLAAHVTGTTLPSHASAFRLERYEDPAYVRLVEESMSGGQL
jgi:glycine/D-amino acid oxidase-like deaminating enzyme